MGLDLTPLDALHFDIGVLAADDMRRVRMARRVVGGAKKSAEVAAAGLMHALYVEG